MRNFVCKWSSIGSGFTTWSPVSEFILGSCGTFWTLDPAEIGSSGLWIMGYGQPQIWPKLLSLNPYFPIHSPTSMKLLAV